MTMIDLTGRTAIVTGAGGGLGRAHALALAAHGARVVVNDLGDGARAVAQEIAANGGEAIVDGTDITDLDAVRAMVTDVEHRWGGLEIPVNNAGILRDRSFAKMEMEDFRAVIEVHLMGSVHCAKAVWEGMRARRHGRIVFTTSSSGLFGNFGQANYAAAKMALVGLMQTLRLEGEKYGIRVNCVAPGPVRTKLAMAVHTQDIIDAYHQAIPLNRYGQEDETANAIYFLASDQASYITGQVLALG